MAKKTTAAAEPVRYFKVLTSDGRSPYVAGYQWTLPTQLADGSWEASPWHDPTPESKAKGTGLFVTTSPRGHRGTGHVAWECEVDGLRWKGCNGDNEAARVRLLRPLPWGEIDRIEAERIAAEEKAEQCEKMDNIRVIATREAGVRKAKREAGVDSPALAYYKMALELAKGANLSRRRLDYARGDAFGFALRYLRCDLDDVCAMVGMGAGIGDGEHVYADVVNGNNPSAVLAVEKYLGRKPWWYRRRHDDKRERVHVGKQVYIDKQWLKVTSFRGDYLNAVSEGKTVRDGDGNYAFERPGIPMREGVGKVVRLTREMLDPPATGAEVAE